MHTLAGMIDGMVSNRNFNFVTRSSTPASMEKRYGVPNNNKTNEARQSLDFNI